MCVCVCVCVCVCARARVCVCSKESTAAGPISDQISGCVTTAAFLLQPISCHKRNV